MKNETSLPEHGDVVRNTKTGGLYKVFGISKHTENGTHEVVYFSMKGENFHRPLNMFIGFRDDLRPYFVPASQADWEQALKEASRRIDLEKCPHAQMVEVLAVNNLMSIYSQDRYVYMYKCDACEITMSRDELSQYAPKADIIRST